MRVRPIRFAQIGFCVAIVIVLLAMFSNEDDIVIPHGGKVMKNIKSFINTDERKKWDPFGLGLPSDTEMGENVIFHAE